MIEFGPGVMALQPYGALKPTDERLDLPVFIWVSPLIVHDAVLVPVLEIVKAFVAQPALVANTAVFPGPEAAVAYELTGLIN